jgi:hypothetical protein
MNQPNLDNGLYYMYYNFSSVRQSDSHRPFFQSAPKLFYFQLIPRMRANKIQKLDFRPMSHLVKIGNNELCIAGRPKGPAAIREEPKRRLAAIREELH